MTNIYIKKSILITFLYFSLICFAKSEIIKKFDITGNDRISDQTILMFSDLDIGQNVNQIQLNEALKELYYTDYFKDIKISLDQGTLTINVIENPIIQRIVKINKILLR